VNPILVAVTRCHIGDARFESRKRSPLVFIEFRGLFDGSLSLKKEAMSA
jgi:hypothetical protein